MGIPALQRHAVAIQSHEYRSSDENGCMSASEEISFISEINRSFAPKMNTGGAFLSSLWAPPMLSTPQTLLSDSIERQNIPSSLQEAWPHLPAPVRVYLDQLQLASESDLGIVYEAPCQNFPEGRWHVFKIKKNEALLAGFGMGALAFLNQSLSGSAPHTPENPPPRPLPSVNIKIGSFIAGTALVVGIDLGIRKAFPFLPSEARVIPNLASFYGFQYVMWKSNLIQTSSWREVWRPITGALPIMTVIGMPTSVLVDKIGRTFELEALRGGGMLHAPITMISSLALYWQLMKSPAGRNFLTASGAGLSGTLGKVARVGGSALLLNMLSRGARSGGSYLGLYFGGSRPGDEAWREGLLDMQAEKIALALSSQDIFGQTGGSILDATLGGLLDAVLTIGEFVSSDIQRGREMEIQAVKIKLIQEGRNTAKEIKEKLAYTLSQNILSDGNIDWKSFQTQISEMYGDADIMSAIYQNFSLIGQREKDAETIRLAIAENGAIVDQSAVLKLARTQAKDWLAAHQSLLPEKQMQLQNLGEAIGNLKVREDQIEIIPPELLTPQQQGRIEAEYLPLSGEVAQMEIMFESMEKLVSTLKL